MRLAGTLLSIFVLGTARLVYIILNEKLSVDAGLGDFTAKFFGGRL